MTRWNEVVSLLCIRCSSVYEAAVAQTPAVSNGRSVR